MNQNAHKSFYQIAGGTLPLDALTYVRREADDVLYRFAVSPQTHSRVCFVLAPRQTGKSSLMVRTAKALTDAGLTSATINLQEWGEVKSEEALYLSLLHSICQQVELPDERLVQHLDDLWAKRQELPPALKFKNFIGNAILGKEGERKLVIFIDEVQTLVRWELQDGFIGTIKALADNTHQPALQRLTFVLLGVAKPSDLSSSSAYALSLGEFIEIGRLGGDLEPLKQGLLGVTDEPVRVLKSVLSWTGGQPFLTQSLCDLVVHGGKIENGSQVADHINKLVSDKIVKNWRARDRLSHLQEIENWFVRCEASQTQEKLAALSLYGEMLQRGSVDFEPGNIAQWDLLISGLVVKLVRDEKECLQLANPIYQQVFTLNWITAKQKFLKENIMGSPLDDIKNRDVYILIDQSGSMVRKDGLKQSRWKLLEEKLLGAVGEILDKEVCQEVKVTVFNQPFYKNILKAINDPEQIEDIFEENRPASNSFVVPTLRACFEKWLQGREQITAQDVETDVAKGAFFIIYTDGQFDDDPPVEDCIKDLCAKVDDHRIFKILIIGIGKGVNETYFDNLDRNLFNVTDMNGKPRNVVVFEMENEHESITEMMDRQLRDTDNVRKGFTGVR
ncbi:MAG: AAA-like domain-containing protein [Cyanobacteriota bacterium]|nr:AAA-like domain-containing protein [Cyanobacteriota bacterium]